MERGGELYFSMTPRVCVFLWLVEWERGELEGLAAVSKWLPLGIARGSAPVSRDASSGYCGPRTFLPQGSQSVTTMAFGGGFSLGSNVQEKHSARIRGGSSRLSVHVRALKRRLCPCFSAQLVTCDTKLRDQCKGTTCNRYSSD